MKQIFHFVMAHRLPRMKFYVCWSSIHVKYFTFHSQILTITHTCHTAYIQICRKIVNKCDSFLPTKYWLTSRRRASPLQFVMLSSCRDWKNPRIGAFEWELHPFYRSVARILRVLSPLSFCRPCAMQIIS